MCKVTQLARGRGRILFICGLLLWGRGRETQTELELETLLL